MTESRTLPDGNDGGASRSQCDRNATQVPLPNCYQTTRCCRRPENKNDRKSLDLQPFLGGEADGIRTRNPRIDRQRNPTRKCVIFRKMRQRQFPLAPLLAPTIPIST